MIIRYYKLTSDGRLDRVIESVSDVPVTEADVLLNQNETMQEPPTEVEGMTPVFREGSWVQVPSAFFEFPVGMSKPEWDGTAWVETVSLEDAKLSKIQEFADLRWAEETGGIVLPTGLEIKTDRESQALLTGAALSATLDPVTPIEWKGANGWFVLLPSDVLQIAGLVRQHVQACFSKEKALAAMVDAAQTVDEVQAIDWNSL